MTARSGAAVVLAGLSLGGFGSACASIGPPRIQPLIAGPFADNGASTELPAAPDVVRFLAIGDVGHYATTTRTSLACLARRSCSERGGCDFTVLLGDNVYPSGVESPRQGCQLLAMGESYPGRAVYLVLGNHDYHPINADSERALRQLDTVTNAGATSRLRGPANFYDFEAGNVHIWGLDTNMLVRAPRYREHGPLNGWASSLGQQLDQQRDTPDGPWHIAVGHHPMLSHGAHGNAGDYRDGGMSLWPGNAFAEFMSEHFLGRAALYISGHDHNIQMFDQIHGRTTAQLVAGSGAKCRTHGRDRSARASYERYSYGYALVEASPKRLTVRIYDERGSAVREAWRTRAVATWQHRLLTAATPLERACSAEISACQDDHDAAVDAIYGRCLRNAGLVEPAASP